MRAYFFTNMYLSSIQNGIQSAHCLQEINNEYPDNEVLKEWATKHKTMYVLNGGTSEQMNGIVTFLTHKLNTLPWAIFKEPSLDNALTCIGIIVPEEIYNRPDNDLYLFSYESELSQLLKSKRFAR